MRRLDLKCRRAWRLALAGAGLLSASAPASDITVMTSNVNSGTYAARLTVSGACDPGDYTVPDGPISSSPAVAPCGELNAGNVDVVSGSVLFRAGFVATLGEGFSVASGASLAVEVGDTVQGAAYVRDESPAAVREYSARFYIDPDSLSLSQDTQQFDNLVAYDAQGSREFLVGVGYNTGMTEKRLFITAFESGGGERTTKGACELALGSGWQYVEAHWKASTGTDGDLQLSVNGGVAQSLASCLSLTGGLSNHSGEISAVEWGAKNILGGSLGTVDLDDFECRRSGGPIGPL